MVKKGMTETQKEMAKLVIMMLDKRARKSNYNYAYFLPKEYVEYCKGFDINSHKLRSFMKHLHLDGHLTREKVHGACYKYTPNPDSKEMMKIIESLIEKPEKKETSKNTPVGTKLTEKEGAVAVRIQEYVNFAKTYKPNSKFALFHGAGFKAKNAINYLVRHSVCNEAQAKYYIIYLHGRGFLTRMKRGVYAITGSKESPILQKIPPIVERVEKVSDEIKQTQKKCLKITYGEKQIMNTISALQEEVNELTKSIRGIHMLLAEMGAAMGEKIQHKLNLQNLFKHKSAPRTQIVKNG